MSQSTRIIEKWINAKFDGKVVLSLVQRDQFYNPQISLIKGREYETKLGKASQVQLGIGDLKEMVNTLNEIIKKMEELIPPKKEENAEED